MICKIPFILAPPPPHTLAEAVAFNKVLLFKSIHPSLQNDEYFITKTITSNE